MTTPVAPKRREKPWFMPAQILRLIWIDPLTVIFLGIFSVLIFLFYTTNFRLELENFFYDTRINLMPKTTPSTHMAILAIDDASIEKLEGDPLRLRKDANKKPYLGIRHLTTAAGILSNTEAKAIVLLMPEYAFPPEDPDFQELRDIVKYDPRFIIGTVGYNQLIPNLRELPDGLEGIKESLAAADTFRSRSNAIVRSIPSLSYRGLKQTTNLPAKVASMTNSDYALRGGNYLIKFNPPSHYPTTKIETLLSAPANTMDNFNGRIIVIGYTSPRSSGVQTTEQAFTNTPLTGYAPTNLSGISTTYLIANAIDNLSAGESLQMPPAWAPILQTILVAALCGASWEFGGLFATLATVAIWTCIFAIHAFLYRWASISIPLADTFLASVLVSIYSASRRIRLDLKSIADQEVATEIKSELAKFQSYFLSGFSTWVSATTETITHLVRSAPTETGGMQANQTLHDRLFLAASDLNEYLTGIGQLSTADGNASSSIALNQFDVRQMAESVVRRFDVKAQSRGITFALDIDDQVAVIKSNVQFIDAILFNFISNAVKYAHPKSTVDIRIFPQQGRFVVFSVTDDGPGIAPEFHERVFERFYRINDERLYSAKGTGVGLYLCRYFAESLGGRVELDSSVSIGSEFRAVIPWKK